MDIVTPLGLAGIRCVAAVRPEDPTRHSRFVDGTIDRLDPWSEPEAYVERLVAWATKQPAPPVLFYPSDGELLMVSRHRERLRTAFTFLIPEAELVEDLVDKERFRALATRAELPVPPSRELPAGTDVDSDLGLPFPVIVKPNSHRDFRRVLDRNAKAVHATTPEELRAIRVRAREADVDCVVQALVPGPESRIESYHAFVDESGAVVAEFTGEKLRTDPPAYGQSTAVRVGLRDDVLEAGRRVLSAIGMCSGVAKVDFKRDPDGRLWLLEINPRFSLWHHPGAVAGINLPAEVYAHLVGRPLPGPRPFRTGVSWCDLRGDRRALRAVGAPITSYLRSLAATSTWNFGARTDPMPLLRGVVLPALHRRLPGPARKRAKV
ncbi:MAG: carboxylate--amine ligase [Pseudonocardia sp.]